MKRLFSTLIITMISALLYAQKVGINTTTPLETLDVRGTGYFSDKLGLGVTSPQYPLSFSSTNGDKISFWGSSGAHYGIGLQPALLQIHTYSSYDDIAFGYGSSASFTERMRIRGNGNVGIGIPVPAVKLHVSNGTVRFEGPASSGGTALSVGGFGDVLADAPGVSGGRFIIKDNGNVGIGTNAPSQKLQVNGNICATGTITNCSDIRYKQNISPIAHSLTAILSLNGLYYNWKKKEFPQMDFGDERQIGFSAQEVEKLFPEIVVTDANGYKSVDYGRITPILVEAVKEQQKQINAQQEQINELKKMIEQLLTKHQ